jgi:hypothetical protein
MGRHIAIQANVKRFSWNHRGQYGWFEPNGRTAISGKPAAELAANRTLWEADEPLYAGRLFVGFNVGDEERWGMDDVVRIVRRVRDLQVHDPSSSFVYQRGLYSHHEGPGEGHVVDEEGAQIIVLNLPDFGISPAKFEQQIVALAEALAEELEQETVIVEIQRGGVTAKTIAVAGLE